MKIFIFFLIFTTGVWGNWNMFHYNAQNTGCTPYAPPFCDSTEISIEWSVYIGGIVRSSPSLSLSGDSIYIASNSDTLYCISHDGIILWRFDLGAGARYSSPAIDSTGNIYIGCAIESLYAIYPDGTRYWAHKCLSTNGSYHSPTIDYSIQRVYMCSYFNSTGNGCIDALNLDGTFLWNNTMSNGGSYNVICPAIDENHYVFTTDYSNPYGALTCFDTTGTRVWTFLVPNPEGETDFESSPAIDTIRHRIYFGGQDYGHNDSCKYIYAIDYTYSGASIAWKRYLNADVKWCTPAIRGDGSVVIGADNGILHAFSPSGTELWNYTCGGAIHSSPAVDSNGNVYVGCNDGYLYGFWSDGSLRFRLLLDGSSIESSPAISEDNKLYIGTDGGYVYCISICTTSCPPANPTTVSASPDTICPSDSSLLSASSDIIFGTGGASLCNQPVDIDRGCSRSMSLLRWSELPSGFGGGTITGIGIYVNTTGPSPSPVNIRMKTVSYSDIPCASHDGNCQCGPSDCCADWDETGTLVYSGLVDYSSTGWSMITLTTPFDWTSDNLLITWDWCETGSGWACVRGTNTSDYVQFYDFCSDDVARRDQYGWDGSDWTTCCSNNYLINSSIRVDYKLVFGARLMAKNSSESYSPMSDSISFVWFDTGCDSSISAMVDSGENIWVHPESTTTFYVRAYNPYYNCWSDSCLNITVYVDDISANIMTTIGATCAGDTVYLDGNPTGGDGVYISQWTGDTIPLSSTTIQNPFFYTDIGGTYNLIYTVTDGLGCSVSDTIEVDIYTLPYIYIYIMPTCEGDTLFINGNPPDLAQYIWSGPDGFSSFSQDTFIFPASMMDTGWYYLIGIDLLGCENVDSFHFLDIYPKPSANASSDTDSYCVGDTIYLYGEPDSMLNYTWFGPMGFSSNQQNPTIIADDTSRSGWYNLIVTTDHNCSDTDSIYIDINICGCPPAIVWTNCPVPCWNYSSCENQILQIGIMDTSATGIDTMQTFFTAYIYHRAGGIDTISLSEPSASLFFSGDIVGLDSLIANIYSIWSDKDSVVITLDSVFNVDHCKIYPEAK